VQIEGGGFSTYEAARLAGKLELAHFLEQLELEKSRIDWIENEPSRLTVALEARHSPQGKPTIASAASWCGCLTWPWASGLRRRPDQRGAQADVEWLFGATTTLVFIKKAVDLEMQASTAASRVWNFILAITRWPPSVVG
jgi:hypothetical protein